MTANLAFRSEDLEPPVEDNIVSDGGLGSAIARATEALERGELSLPLDFAFRWRDRHTFVSVTEDEAGKHLNISMILGELPYTAEDRGVRTRVGYVVSRSDEMPVGALHIDRHQRAHFSASVPMDAPLSGVAVVTAVVQVLLQVSPYLDLAEPPRRAALA